MKRIITITITILIILTSLSSFGQNQQPKELGIGLAAASDPFEFENMSHYDNFFKDSELINKWDGTKIFPFFYKPDYGLYHFICLDKTDKYYKILINDSEVAYVPNDKHFYFKTWDIILINRFVERKDKSNPIKLDCNDNSKTVIHNCDNDGFIVHDVIEKNKEYWLFVQFPSKCGEDPITSKNLKHGWIKWRTKDKLLVYIYMFY